MWNKNGLREKRLELKYVDKDDLGVIRGCKWELINIFICIDYQLSCDFEQVILLLIYCGHENDHYLINFPRWCLMTNIPIIAMILLWYGDYGENGIISE